MSIEFIKKEKFAAILRHVSPDYIESAARAVYKGGVRVFEITFDPSDKNTIDDTQKSISTIYEMYGNDVSVGAGTVLSVEFAKAAKEAGAQFIVSPCINSKVINYTKENGLLSIPGAFTPTEIMTAYEAGADIVKIFPVLPDNIGYLKTVMSPLSHIPFMPTGGISPNTIEDFLETGAIAVAAGATIVNQELLEAGKFSEIEANAKAHIDRVKSFLKKMKSN